MIITMMIIIMMMLMMTNLSLKSPQNKAEEVAAWEQRKGVSRMEPLSSPAPIVADSVIALLFPSPTILQLSS